MNEDRSLKKAEEKKREEFAEKLDVLKQNEERNVPREDASG